MSRSSGVDSSVVLQTIFSLRSIIQTLENSLDEAGREALDNEYRPSPDDSPSRELYWNSVSILFPSLDDCEVIITAYFERVSIFNAYYVYDVLCMLLQASWFYDTVHEPTFRYYWDRLRRKEAVSRPFVALALCLIGNTLFLATTANLSQRLPHQNMHRTFVERGYRVLYPEHGPFVKIPQCIEYIQVQVIICTYMTMTEWAEELWAAQGQLLTMAKAVHLFDERKWAFDKLSDWDIELRRRLGHTITHIDGWVSLHFVHASEVQSNLLEPSFLADCCYDLATGSQVKVRTTFDGTLSYSLIPGHVYHQAKVRSNAALRKVSHFLFNYSQWTQEKRYTEAKNISMYIESLNDDIPEEYRFEVAGKQSNFHSKETLRRAAESLIIHSSRHRLQVTLFRQFMLDKDAPTELCRAALEHSRSIIETAPALLAATLSPLVAFSPAWGSGNLLCAASTYALVYLLDGDQMRASNMLEWYANEILTVIEALNILSAHDSVAKRCCELLVVLCSHRKALRTKFMATVAGQRALAFFPHSSDPAFYPDLPAEYRKDFSESRSRGERSSRKRPLSQTHLGVHLDTVGSLEEPLRPPPLNPWQKDRYNISNDPESDDRSSDDSQSSPLSEEQWNALVRSLNLDMTGLASYEKPAAGKLFDSVSHSSF